MFNRNVLFPSLSQSTYFRTCHPPPSLSLPLSQYGLVSWGPGNEDVGLGQYDVNTDIAYYKDWITGIQVIIIDSFDSSQ